MTPRLAESASGFSTHGKRDAARGEERIVLERDAAEARHAHAGGGEALAHLVLVARGADRGDDVRAEPEALRDRGGRDGGEVVDADDGVERAALGEARDRLRGRGGIREVDGQQVIGDGLSNVLGFSDAQTRSTPSVVAASTKSSVR